MRIIGRFPTHTHTHTHTHTLTHIITHTHAHTHTHTQTHSDKHNHTHTHTHTHTISEWILLGTSPRKTTTHTHTHAHTHTHTSPRETTRRAPERREPGQSVSKETYYSCKREAFSVTCLAESQSATNFNSTTNVTTKVATIQVN